MTRRPEPIEILWKHIISFVSVNIVRNYLFILLCFVYNRFEYQLCLFVLSNSKSRDRTGAHRAPRPVPLRRGGAACAPTCLGANCTPEIIVQRIVNCPMDFNWDFPMDFHFCDFWCVTFCPESLSRRHRQIPRETTHGVTRAGTSPGCGARNDKRREGRGEGSPA